MIEIADTGDDRLAPDDQTLAVISRAIDELLHARSETAPAELPTGRARRSTWRFSGRSWARPSHEVRDRPRR